MPDKDSRARRVASGVVLAVCCGAVVALLLAQGGWDVRRADLEARGSGAGLGALAQRLAAVNGDANEQIASWEAASGRRATGRGTAEQQGGTATWRRAVTGAALLQGFAPARLQMLALPPTMMLVQRGRGGSGGYIAGPSLAADGGSKLCQKKQMLVDKFDELLRKLGVDIADANATMAVYTREFQDAMTAWLDASAQYRLAREKEREARQGAAYANEEYEKWRQAHKQAQKSQAQQAARHAAQRAALEEEEQVIRDIMRYLGVLHDVKASAKSVAAGGRNSVKDGESGVSDPFATDKASVITKLASKVDSLAVLIHKSSRAGTRQALAHKLAQIQALPIYSETEEVAKILTEMLSDIAGQLKAIKVTDAQALLIVHTSYGKMVEWEKKLVRFANAADRAKAGIAASEPEREELTAKKRTDAAWYSDEQDHYQLTMHPFGREIYIITLIKNKIIQHCEDEAAATAAAAAQ